jgi:Zn-finger nucleic acid-binding protein
MIEIYSISGVIGIYVAFNIFVVGRRSYWLKHKELDELIEKEKEEIRKYSEVIETYDGLDEKFDGQRATLIQIYEYAKKNQLDDLLKILHNGLI